LENPAGETGLSWRYDRERSSLSQDRSGMVSMPTGEFDGLIEGP